MFHNTIKLYETGTRVNEDAVGSGNSYIFVIDGASGLNSRNIMGEESDAKWLASMTAKLLEERLPDSAASLPIILTDIMKDLAYLWRGNPEDYPSASVAIWRQRGDILEYFGLADCDASVMLKTGEILSWSEERVRELDEKALKSMLAYSKKYGCTMAMAYEACSEILLRNRQLKNTADGYWVLDPTCVGIPHARTASIPVSDCHSLFLCSDGFSQLIGFQEFSTLEALHRAVQEKGIDTLARRLFQLQENDKDMIALPRFKFRDDTSAVFSYVEG